MSFCPFPGKERTYRHSQNKFELNLDESIPNSITEGSNSYCRLFHPKLQVPRSELTCSILRRSISTGTRHLRLGWNINYLTWKNEKLNKELKGRRGQ
ncbi:unnamed protein product [Coffea canephora]|uniref:Uncharacterized protein n=1 Tax=Coffea canephora TaxID=49390 RepID=A0A068U2Q5_COFCA|nr:unnamed protein product [Coffea canephora]